MERCHATEHAILALARFERLELIGPGAEGNRTDSASDLEE